MQQPLCVGNNATSTTLMQHLMAKSTLCMVLFRQSFQTLFKSDALICFLEFNSSSVSLSTTRFMSLCHLPYQAYGSKSVSLHSNEDCSDIINSRSHCNPEVILMNCKSCTLHTSRSNKCKEV